MNFACDAALKSLIYSLDISSDIMVTYATYWVPYPLTHRNFVVAKTVKKLPDGGFSVVQTSINSKDYPFDPNFVRGVANIAGYVLHSVPDQPNQTRMIRIAQIDPKGNIPAMVVNTFKTKTAKVLFSFFVSS